MKTIFHPANQRGHANHGWLNAYHSFSFANFHDPSKVHFGLLRVLNDDTVAPGMGFGTHPHDNMEIVTIPLSGALEHKDSMGNSSVINHGEVQVMSAGTGVSHSEFNHSKTEEVKLLQIWVFPKEKNITPRYDQRKYNLDEINGQFKTLVSADKTADAMWINQDAYFSLGKFNSGKIVQYQLKNPTHGVYIFFLEGSANIGPHQLSKRDGLGIWDISQVELSFTSDSEVLLIEVPMN